MDQSSYRTLDCYSLKDSDSVGRVYACSRAAYTDFRSKHAYEKNLPETCPSASPSPSPSPSLARVRERKSSVRGNLEGGTGICLVSLRHVKETKEQGEEQGKGEEKEQGEGKGGRYLFVLDDAQDLWSWALLPSRLVRLAEEEQFVLIGVEEASERRRAVLAWGLATYSFEIFRTRGGSRPPQLLLEERDCACAEEARILCHGRDLINTPANVLGAERSEQEVRAVALERGGVFRTICGEALLTENYPLIHAVGRSAREEPRLLEVRWEAPNSKTKSKTKSLAIVGKGVCFDSGGLNVKDARSMRLMKKDMGGLAHALALAQILRARKTPLNIRLLLPVAENAISRDAMRPSDIYTSRKGDTVEIGHTDAEGRLLLADTLWEASAPEKRVSDKQVSDKQVSDKQVSDKQVSDTRVSAGAPDLVVDFATLTGAARVATGPLLPNMFANDDLLAEQLLACATAEQDPLWRMPLWQDYRHALRSRAADISSSGSWPYAGSITAALFLQNFVAPSILWIHLDIMAWNERMRAGRPEGGELQGVRALAAFLDSWSRC